MAVRRSWSMFLQWHMRNCTRRNIGSYQCDATCFGWLNATIDGGFECDPEFIHLAGIDGLTLELLEAPLATIYSAYLSRCHALAQRANETLHFPFTHFQVRSSIPYLQSLIASGIDSDFCTLTTLYALIAPRLLQVEVVLAQHIQGTVISEALTILIALLTIALFGIFWSYYNLFGVIVRDMNREILQSIGLLWVVISFLTLSYSLFTCLDNPLGSTFNSTWYSRPQEIHRHWYLG